MAAPAAPACRLCSACPSLGQRMANHPTQPEVCYRCLGNPADVPHPTASTHWRPHPPVHVILESMTTDPHAFPLASATHPCASFWSRRAPASRGLFRCQTTAAARRRRSWACIGSLQQGRGGIDSQSGRQQALGRGEQQQQHWRAAAPAGGSCDGAAAAGRVGISSSTTTRGGRFISSIHQGRAAQT